MLFQRVNRSDAEKVFVVVKNVSGGALVAGEAVCWDSSATVDGVNVTTPATATLSAFAGVTTEAVADDGYSVIQVYGYKSDVQVLNDITTAMVAGQILLPVNGDGTFSAAAATSDASDGKSGFVVTLQTLATATTPISNDVKCFIRAM
jgi:hypothetical protein